MTTEAHVYSQTLGEEESIWFKILPFINADEPMGVLMQLSERHGGCIPIKMRSERIFLLSDVEHIRHVLVDSVDNYIKYFDGLHAIFGKSGWSCAMTTTRCWSRWPRRSTASTANLRCPDLAFPRPKLRRPCFCLSIAFCRPRPGNSTRSNWCGLRRRPGELL